MMDLRATLHTHHSTHHSHHHGAASHQLPGSSPGHALLLSGAQGRPGAAFRHDSALWLVAQGDRDAKDAWRECELDLKVCMTSQLPHHAHLGRGCQALDTGGPRAGGALWGRCTGLTKMHLTSLTGVCLAWCKVCCCEL